MGIALKRFGLACGASVGLLALTAMNASATPITNVVNGSFEETTAPHWDYWGTGTFSPAASWIDLTQTGNAGSLSSGLESITATAGTRLLRLATEANGINGRYAQYLGTMVAGETYTFRADVIASSLAYGTYTAKAAFVNEATATPGTTYASQTASAPQGGTGGFILSYTALPADDGLVGPTWDSTTILYYSAAQSSVQPHVTLTLASNAGLGKLTVWYTRWTEAGIFVPYSLTVSDDFGHNSTTVFTVPPGNHGVFTQDVALTGMEGTVLHLNFATASEAWLGLNEIRVSAAR